MDSIPTTRLPRNLTLAPGKLEQAVAQALAAMRTENVIPRLWDHDHTLWKPAPTEIANRLGWLASPQIMRQEVASLRAFAERVWGDGYTEALLLGMGGSSLAPEVFQKILGGRAGSCNLAVLDSTDPGAVLAATQNRDPGRTLFVVSTKSGGTVETLSFFKYVYRRVVNAVGAEQAGRHFIAITDPCSSLVDLAEQHRFREVSLNDPDIGGRYSGLSLFGLVPAALSGADIALLLERAGQIAEACRQAEPVDNPGAALGAAIGALARTGRDKLTFAISPQWAGLGDWIEQLVAESTGKEGTGILPVIGEPLVGPDMYGDDRVFVHIRLRGDSTHDHAITALRDAGHPIIRLDVDNDHDLGGQMFLWEFATAVAGWRLGINPFNQPDVESAKVGARTMIAAYQRDGRLPETAPTFTDGDIDVWTDDAATTLQDALASFLDHATSGCYIAVQAYLQPSAATDQALASLRAALRRRSHCATTVGYGPRFLHSTGQLHKGDNGRGLFVQITSETVADVAIPDDPDRDSGSVTFGALKQAQALGDRAALRDAGRRVIRLHLHNHTVSTLQRVTASV